MKYSVRLATLEKFISAVLIIALMQLNAVALSRMTGINQITLSQSQVVLSSDKTVSTMDMSASGKINHAKGNHSNAPHCQDSSCSVLVCCMAIGFTSSQTDSLTIHQSNDKNFTIQSFNIINHLSRLDRPPKII